MKYIRILALLFIGFCIGSIYENIKFQKALSKIEQDYTNIEERNTELLNKLETLIKINDV